MTSPYLTRAHEWLGDRADIEESCVLEDCNADAESLAALLTQVRNETLEEAAKEADELVSDPGGGDAAAVIALNIRSLKSPG